MASFFKKLGKGIKNVGKGLTKVASFSPVGGIFSSAANAALEGKDIGKSVIGDLGRNAKIGATLLPIAMSGGAAAGVAGAGGGGGMSGLLSMGGLKKLGSFALDNQDLILGGLSAWDAHQSGKKADKAAKEALDFARSDYAARAPLREAGMKRLLASPPPERERLDPSARVTFDPGPYQNPFLR